ncbi:MAG: type I-C CRISPR-associated protein Cas7/Csd2 [Flavobacteriales bacterium]
MSLNNRYDFVLLFDVKDGNPNGDPDAGNLPRIDAETGHGLVTDVSIKRKVRNYVNLVKPEQDDEDAANYSEGKGSKARHHIFVREKGILNNEIEKAYAMSPEVKAGVEAWQKWKQNSKKKDKGAEKAARPSRHYEDIARDWMCHNFFDIRTFGAVMSTGDEKESGDGEEGTSKLKRTAGQVRGPVQLTFARSVDPIVALEHSITRMAVTNEKDLEKERTMGRKHTVPYGVYVAHGFVSAFLAKQTGFSEDDLNLLWQSLEYMFEQDRSAARGQMAACGLYVFKHDSELGNAHAQDLFARIRVRRKDGMDVARNWHDYQVIVDEDNMPNGVKLERIYERKG